MTDSPPASAARPLVIIPTYDERENLARIVARLRAAVPDCDVLVVDDASPDGTGALADDLARADAAVAVLHRDAKRGLGGAYVAGFRWALARGYAVVVEMDADGSHQPEQLPRLLQAVAAGADLALGSRWVPGGSVVNWPARRRLLSRGGNTYVRIALGLPVRDATGGFRAFRADTLRGLPFKDVASHGYCFQVDMLWRAVLAGATVTEVPITFVEREFGTSKMSGSIVREALWRVTLWGGSHRAAQARLALRRDRSRGTDHLRQDKRS